MAGSDQAVAGWTGPPLVGRGDTAGLLNLLFEGLASAARQGGAVGLIAFLLIVRAVLVLVMHNGAVQRGMASFIRRGVARLHLLQPSLFTLGGAVFGMGEAAVAFCLLLAPLLVRLGDGSLCAVLATHVATRIGFATRWMNPCSVAVAQGDPGVPVGSGGSPATMQLGVRAGVLTRRNRRCASPTSRAMSSRPGTRPVQTRAAAAFSRA